MQAPGGRPEALGLWAWLRLKLAISLLAFHKRKDGPPSAHTETSDKAAEGPVGATKGAAVADPDPAIADPDLVVAGDGHTVYGHIEGLLEATSFWELIGEVVAAGKPRAACLLLQQAFVQLGRAGLLRFFPSALCFL